MNIFKKDSAFDSSIKKIEAQDNEATIRLLLKEWKEPDISAIVLKKSQITGYPTLIKIKNGEIDEFSGNRTIENIKLWLKANKQTAGRRRRNKSTTGRKKRTRKTQKWWGFFSS
jgi:protein-disulfide isomerase-like protein with CxxC motif